ncbi:hypothetical protein ABW19_dt0205854 [Dactylella cylindrospora]|nr:hypothetical protein ABW19_dt0205854 [Dactylella cylindrospora]
MPRFIMFIRADEEAESGKMPEQEVVVAMTNYWKEMNDAGVIVYADGMHASSKGARVIFPGKGEAPTVQKGPFPVNELVCGFWILEVKDYDEAIYWAKKCPIDNAPQGGCLELRPFVSLEDAGDAFTPEMKEEYARDRKLEDERLGFKSKE